VKTALKEGELLDDLVREKIKRGDKNIFKVVYKQKMKD